MRNLGLALLVLWLWGCTTLADYHQRRIADVSLIRAEANFLNRCSNPKLEGLPACTWPAVWPYTASSKTGEVSTVQLLPSFPLIGALLP